MDAIRNNPAAFAAAIRALLQAVVTILVAFGFPISPAQQAAVLELGAALIAVSLIVSSFTIANTVPKSPTPTAPPAALQTPAGPPAPPAAGGV